jgi:glycosyltransferase involved in cell wall biosynthesis
MNAPFPEPKDCSAIFDNAAWSGAAPQLSVLVPFMRDDPKPLLEALGRQTRPLGGRVEIVVLDDGGGDDALVRTVRETLDALDAPARLAVLAINEGRARGRNRLVGHARAEYLLFLDADMLPDSDGFLAAYLDLIDQARPPVVFGGFSVLQAPPVAAHALHRTMALSSDCLPAARRAQTPEKYIYTSNLLIRRDVFQSEAFDERFCGWGWEDVEWGMRVGQRYPITHVDNPATHLGLDTAKALIGKYRQSVANFARIAAMHPAILAAYPSYKVARALKRAPLRGLWRPILGWAAQLDWAPAKPRAFALRLYRCALYAEVV